MHCWRKSPKEVIYTILYMPVSCTKVQTKTALWDWLTFRKNQISNVTTNGSEIAIIYTSSFFCLRIVLGHYCYCTWFLKYQGNQPLKMPSVSSQRMFNSPAKQTYLLLFLSRLFSLAVQVSKVPTGVLACRILHAVENCLFRKHSNLFLTGH